jgi:hypothetical protein
LFWCKSYAREYQAKINEKALERLAFDGELQRLDPHIR